MSAKISRDPLREDTARSTRYHEVLSPESNMLTGNRAKRKWSVEMQDNMCAANTEKAVKSWNPAPQMGTEFEAESIDNSKEFRPKKLRKGDSLQRKIAIQYIFKSKLNSPERSEWKSKKVVSKIMEYLGMPEGSRKSVISVLDATLAGENPSLRLSNRGRKSNFTDYSEEADFLCNIFENTDSSDSTVAAIINLRRVAQGGVDSKTTSRTAVRNFRVNSDVLDTSARDLENMGSTDVKSTWNKSRVALYTQFREQLRLGDLLPDHQDVVNSPFKPRKLYGMLFLIKSTTSRSVEEAVKDKLEFPVVVMANHCPKRKAGNSTRRKERKQ